VNNTPTTGDKKYYYHLPLLRLRKLLGHNFLTCPVGVGGLNPPNPPSAYAPDSNNVVSTLAQSYVDRAATGVGMVAELAAERKLIKYSNLPTNLIF